MRRKTLLNRNVIIVLMLFIFLMTAFVSTAYSFWYFPNSGNPKEVSANIYHDDIEENFKKDTSNYLKIIDCRDGVIPDYDDFAMQGESGFLDNSINFTDNGNIFQGKNGDYSKKVFYVSSLELGSLVSSVSYRSGTSITSLGTSATGSGTSVTGSDTSTTEIYLYDLLNSQYKLVDHLTNESIELKDGKGTSSDESYSSTKFEDYRKNIGRSFFKSRILFLVPRDTKWINNKQPETLPKVDSDYNIYFHNEATGGDDPSKKDPNKKDYSNLDHVWLWNDRTDFGVSLPLVNCSKKKDDTNYNKSVHINYETLYQVCNDLCDTTKQSGFIMTPQTAPTGIVFKTEKGTDFAPKDDKNREIEYLALPLPPNNSKFDIYINAAKDGKFTIKTDQDVDLTKNKNIVYYSANGLDHLWMWSNSPSSPSDDRCWISSNYVYKFEMTGCNKVVSCFSYNYGEKFNFYKKWTGSIVGTSKDFSRGFTFDKNEAGEKINYDYDNLVLTNYKGEIQADADGKDGRDNISGLFNGTSECNGDCTSIYLLENNKHVVVYTSKDHFIKELNKLN